MANRRFPVATVDGLALAWLSVQDQALLIVSAVGELAWMNPAAERLLDGAHDLIARDGFLTLHHHASAAEIRSFLLRLDDEPVSLVLPCRDGVSRLVISGRRIPTIKGERLVGLKVAQTHRSALPLQADFAASFGLTPSEDRVAGMLLIGMTVSDAAEKLGSSISTVRTHVRSIYAKLDVKSRESFFYKLQPFRVG